MTLSAYSIEQEQSFPISDGLAEVSEPVFDRSGKYLYLFGSTDAGPGARLVRAVHGRQPPHAQRVSGRAAQRSAVAAGARERRGEAEAEPAEPRQRREARRPTRTQRPIGAAAPPSRCASISRGSSTASSICRFRPAISRTCRWATPVSSTTCAPAPTAPTPAGPAAALRGGSTVSIWQARRTSRSSTACATIACRPTARSSSTHRATTWSIVPVADAEDQSGRWAARRRRTSRCKIDPRAEWTQIFDEAWRINRDYFYAPNMHGVDWPAMQEEVRRAAARRRRAERSQSRDPVDVERAVGRPSPRRRRRSARDAEDGAGRAARRRLQRRERPLSLQEGVRRPQLESAAARAAHRAGRQRARRRVSARGRAAGTCGRRRTSTASSRTRGQDRRDHRRPEPGRQRLAHRAGRADRERGALRNRDWVEGNLRKVDAATGGRVAYVYVPNTAQPGLQLLQALLLSAVAQGRRDRRRALQRRRAGRRLLHRPPAPAAHQLLGDALRRRPARRRPPRSRGRR